VHAREITSCTQVDFGQDHPPGRCQFTSRLPVCLNHLGVPTATFRMFPAAPARQRALRACPMRRECPPRITRPELTSGYSNPEQEMNVLDNPAALIVASNPAKPASSDDMAPSADNIIRPEKIAQDVRSHFRRYRAPGRLPCPGYQPDPLPGGVHDRHRGRKGG